MNAKSIFREYYNGETNFMTPNLLKFLKIKMGEEYLVIEISYGSGLFDTTLYGVSTLVHNPLTGETMKIDLSKSFKKLESAKSYIRLISKEMFDNADRYGEVKVI